MKIKILFLLLLLPILSGIYVLEQAKAKVENDIVLIPHSFCNPKFKDLKKYLAPGYEDKKECLGLIVVRNA